MYRRLLFTFVGLPLLAVTALADDSTADLNDLLEALVAKQVFTRSEADGFRARWKARHETDAQVAEAPVAPPATPATSIVATTVASPAAQKSAAAYFGRIHFSGYVQARFTEAPVTNNTFEIRRARIIADGNLASRISYQIQVDGVKPQLLDARVDFKLAPQFRVTVGQFKIPFSSESIAPDDQTDAIERSTVVNNYAPGRENGANGRDLGIQFSGRLLRWRAQDRIEYAIAVFNGAGINTKDDNHYKDTVARLIFHPVSHLSVGGDYYNGANGIKEISKEREDVEIGYLRGPFNVNAEYIWGHDGPIHRRGWYAETAYRVSPRWQPLFRFDKFDPRQRTATLNASDNYVFGTNLYFNDFVKLSANYDLQRDLIGDRTRNILLLQTQFSFGTDKEGK